MLDMVKEYRINASSVYRSQLPIERKQTILTNLLEQITALYRDQPENLSSHVAPLSEEERFSLQELCSEIQEALNELQSLQKNA